jgi:hypothetical protein
VQIGSKEAAATFVQKVQHNYKGYTKRKILQAKEAGHRMGMIGNPSKGDFKKMVRGNMINNCPVITNAITKVHAIFGPDLPSLRGKTVQRTPAPVVADYLSVPRELVEQNMMVMLTADIFFLLTVLRQIKFMTTEHVTTCMAKSLSKHLQ